MQVGILASRSRGLEGKKCAFHHCLSFRWGIGTILRLTAEVFLCRSHIGGAKLRISRSPLRHRRTDFAFSPEPM